MPAYTASLVINAMPSTIFNALTRPELVKLWQFNKVVCADWKPGNEIRFKADFEEKTLEQWGTILDVRLHERISYTLFTPKDRLKDQPENYAVTSYDLIDGGSFTTVKLSQRDHTVTGFDGINLMPILVSLKVLAESLQQQRKDVDR